MSPEELKREQEALENITRWTGEYVRSRDYLNLCSRSSLSHIVDIFPLKLKKHADLTNGDSGINDGPSTYEALLSQIPGDKSTKSLRVFPISRPGSRASGSSTRSRLSSSKLNGSLRGKEAHVFVKLDVDLT